jgi:hypothetical protein
LNFATYFSNQCIKQSNSSSNNRWDNNYLLWENQGPHTNQRVRGTLRNGFVVRHRPS